MERLRSDILHEYCLRIPLFREDIDRIIDLLTESGCEVTISDNEHKFDDLDDLKSHRGSEIGELRIRANRKVGQSIELEFEDSIVGIPRIGLHGHFSSTDEPSDNGSLKNCWHEIRDLLNQRRQWYHSAFTPFLGLLGVYIISMIGLSYALPLTSKHSSPNGEATSHTGIGFDTVRALLFVASLCYLGVSLYIWRQCGTIWLDRRHEVSNFWKRNGDKVLVGVVLLFIGGVIGAFIKSLTG